MIMKKIFVPIVLILFFSSCTIKKPLQIRDKVTTELNTVLSSEIGNAVITESEVIKKKAIEINETFFIKSGFMKFDHLRGSIYPLQFSHKDYDFYFLKSNLKGGNYWGIAVNSTNSKEVFPALISMVNITKVFKKQPLINKTELIEIIESCDYCYKQELIYGGKVGNVVKFTYREYIGNLARPSFFQDLEYDIEESNIIGFKGIRMKILKTTNTFIQYEVINSFTPLKTH